MAQGFEVKPAALDTAAGDLHQAAVAVRTAKGFSGTYLQQSWGGGMFLADAGAIVNDVESTLRFAYPENAHDLERAAHALRSTATAYRGSDHRSAVAMDRRIRDLGELYDWDDEVPDYATASRGIDQADVAVILADPGNRNDGVERFLDLEEKVKKVIALGHEADAITAIGLPNPFVGWADDWEGEWGRLGVAAAGMESLGKFWNRLGGEVDATAAYLDQRWDGNAAGVAAAWFNDAAHECYQHGEALLRMGDEVFAKGLLLNDAVSSVLEVAADLVDLVTSVVELVKEVGDVTTILDVIKHPLSIFSEAYDKAKLALSALHKLEALLKHVGKVITLARAAVEVFLAMLADWRSPSDSSVVQAPYFAPVGDLPGGGR